MPRFRNVALTAAASAALLFTAAGCGSGSSSSTENASVSPDQVSAASSEVCASLKTEMQSMNDSASAAYSAIVAGNTEEAQTKIAESRGLADQVISQVPSVSQAQREQYLQIFTVISEVAQANANTPVPEDQYESMMGPVEALGTEPAFKEAESTITQGLMSMCPAPSAEATTPAP